MSEYNEKQAYLDIFKRESAIYEATPPWHLIARSKLRKKIRYAYGDAIGSGNNVRMPDTAFKQAWETFRLSEAGWWIIAGCLIIAIIAGVWWVTTWGFWEDEPSKPLPPGIQQRGYSFVIPPDYATRANYEDIKAGDLCNRLPRWESMNGDDTKSASRKDGSIVITCVMDE